MKNKTPEKAPTIDEYVEAERETIDRAAVRRLIGFSHRVRLKLVEPGAGAHPQLLIGAERLLLALEQSNVVEIPDPLPSALREAGMAIRYLLKGMDLIPDSVPDVGFVDDAMVVAKVIERNPEFGATSEGADSAMN